MSLVGCAWVADRATLCRILPSPGARVRGNSMVDNTRSKFNVALGIEAQGFCTLR